MMMSYKVYPSGYSGRLSNGDYKNLNSAVEDSLKNGNKTILLKDGRHHLENTVYLNHGHSGLSIKADQNAKPVLCGGISLKCDWKAYKAGVYVTKVDSGLEFDQLFVNGIRQIRARFPNKDESTPGVTGYLSGVDQVNDGQRCIKYNSDGFTTKKWLKPEKAIVHMFHEYYWGNMQFEVKDIDYEENVLFFGKGGYQLRCTMGLGESLHIGEASRWFIENVFEELDDPMEWFHDEDENNLYFYPKYGVDLDRAIIEVPLLDSLIHMNGSQENPVKDITIEGLEMTISNTTFLKEYFVPSLGDWSLHANGMIYLEGCESCSIEHNYFNQNGSNSIYFNHYNKNCSVKNNLIVESGESGICVTGDKWRTIGSQKFYSDSIVIENNIIHDIGVYGKQVAGVFLSVCKGIEVLHNRIFNVPRSAICINDGTWGGHLITYNDIFNTVRETGDHGPFNSWGRDSCWCREQSHGSASHCAGNVLKDAKYTVIIEQNKFTDDSGWGIDLDDGSSNYIVRKNLCIGISVKLREGDYRTVENNIFYRGANPPGFHVGYEDNNDVFRRNIIVSHTLYDNPEVDATFKKSKSPGNIYDLIGPPMKGPWFKAWDNNLFFSNLDDFAMQVTLRGEDFGLDTGDVKKLTLDEWREKGYDQHSIFADPLFVDEDHGDFRLKENSPAFHLGIESLDYDHFGPVDFAYKWDNILLHCPSSC